MCAFTYVFNQIHIHVYIYIYIHRYIYIYICKNILVEEGEEGGDKPNHVTLRSVPQDC